MKSIHDLWNMVEALQESDFNAYDTLQEHDNDLLDTLLDLKGDREEFEQIFYLYYLMQNPSELHFFRNVLNKWQAFKGEDE